MISVFSDDAVSLAALRGLRVVVVGYGNQARAQALNLRDSGISVTVALRPRSPSRAPARRDRFAPVSLRDGARQADILLLLIPDERHPEVYAALEPLLRPGAALGFAHGFSLVFGGLRPRADLDVFLVAPVGPGTELRRAFESGSGIPALVAVAQDATGGATTLALATAKGIGCTRAGAVWTTVRDEAVIDLFGEQACLCGGVTALVSASYRTLVARGYPAELAYLECVQQLKLTVDLLNERGPEGLREAISTTALFGMRETERALARSDLAGVLRRRLQDIESGAFARRFQGAVRRGGPELNLRHDVSDKERELASSGRVVRSLFLRGKAGLPRSGRSRKSS
jgi:ketol-acid reductoisomerase